jgi:hypothetical protein
MIVFIYRKLREFFSLLRFDPVSRFIGNRPISEIASKPECMAWYTTLPLGCSSVGT